jgi:hypothetical protein
LNVVRGTEDEGDLHDSTTTLLDPSEGDVPITITNNDNISRTRNASMSSRRSSDFHRSEDDLYVPLMSFVLIHLQMFSACLFSRSPAKRRNCSLEIFFRQIIACSWQFIVFVVLIAFIIRTESTAYPIVPRHLGTLYQQYPQGTATAITLVGSLLSLLSGR